MDRHVAGPAVQPTGRRRPATERPDRAAVRRQLGQHGHQGAGAVRQAPIVAQHRRREPRCGPDPDAGSRPGDARLRVGRGPGQRLPPRRVVQRVLHHLHRRPSCSSTTAATSSRGARRRTRCRSTAPRAAPSCSARARSSGPGAWTTPGPPPTPTCARRRSTCSRTWVSSRTRSATPGSPPPPGRRTHPRRPRASPSPANGTSVGDGTAMTISGTAADSGGGIVAGVEVSTDGGTTWRPATGTTSWSYSWVAHGNPSTTIRTRAVDDSGNIENPSAGRQRQRGLHLLHLGNRVGSHAERLGQRDRGRGRREVPVRRLRQGDRGPVLQEQQEHGDPRGEPVDGIGHQAGDGDVQQRDDLRLAAGHVLDARCRSTRTRPTWCRTSRRTGTRRRTRTTSSRTPRRGRMPAATSTVLRCTRCATRTAS